MPTTVNGVGTHYYGKRNRHTRRDYCHSCRQLGELVSYDTTLWFVIVFIPIIPLGRKRITDECQFCHRHYVADLKKWEMQRQLSISGTLDEFRKNPSLATALETHGALAGFRQMEDAKKFRAGALELLGEQEELLLGFANHLDHINSHDDATEYYERLLELRPDSPEARFGVAVRKANAGQLDEALKLLDFLMQPGAGKLYTLGLLEFLADRYQATGHADKAVPLYEQLLRETPALGQSHAFRKKIRKAETAAHRETSLLPESKTHWWDVFNPGHQGVSPGTRWAAYTAVAVLFAMIGLAIRNEYLRTHRTLYIVSGLPGPWTVQVDNLPPVSPSPLTKVVVAEGPHRITIQGPQPSEENIEFHSRYWQRFSHRPAWVYNLKKSAALVEATVYYATPPRTPEMTIANDQNFKSFDHIDHPFEEPPKSVSVSNKQETIVRTLLQVVPASPVEIVAMHVKDASSSVAMDVAEAFLLSAPADEQLGLLYTSIAQKQQSVPRARQFFKQRLDATPVDVEWHRAYQVLSDTAEGYEDLLKEYHDRWQKQPEDGKLLYLYARLIREHEAHDDLMKKAAALVPDSHRPVYALAYQASSSGNWEACLTHLDDAEKRGASAASTAALRHAAMIGTGRTDELIRGYVSKPSSTPKASADMILLFDALNQAGRDEEISKEFAAWHTSLTQTARNHNAESVADLQLMADAMQNDLTALQQSLSSRTSSMSMERQFSFWLTLKQPDVVVKSADAIEKITDGWMRLSVAISLMLHGDKELAKSWIQAAAATMKSESYSDRFAAGLLESDQPPSDEQLRASLLNYSHQGLLLSALALRFPEARDRLLPLIQKLDVSRLPMFIVIHQTVEALKSKPTDPSSKES